MTVKYHKSKMPISTEVVDMAIIGSLGFVQTPDKIIVRIIDVNGVTYRTPTPERRQRTRRK